MNLSLVVSSPARPMTKPSTSASEAYAAAFSSLTEAVLVKRHAAAASALTRFLVNAHSAALIRCASSSEHGVAPSPTAHTGSYTTTILCHSSALIDFDTTLSCFWNC